MLSEMRRAVRGSPQPCDELDCENPGDGPFEREDRRLPCLITGLNECEPDEDGSESREGEFPRDLVALDEPVECRPRCHPTVLPQPR